MEQTLDVLVAQMLTKQTGATASGVTAAEVFIKRIGESYFHGVWNVEAEPCVTE